MLDGVTFEPSNAVYVATCYIAKSLATRQTLRGDIATESYQKYARTSLRRWYENRRRHWHAWPMWERPRAQWFSILSLRSDSRRIRPQPSSYTPTRLRFGSWQISDKRRFPEGNIEVVRLLRFLFEMHMPSDLSYVEYKLFIYLFTLP